jgi:hypothetical protein
MPIDPSMRNGSLLSRELGDAAGGKLERSEVRPLAPPGGPGGLRPAKVPLASVTVLMPLSSRVLLSILPAASPLEKRGGSCGRVLREEKKRGEGGWSSRRNGAVLDKLKWSSEYRERGCAFRRLCKGSLTGSVGGREAGAGVRLLKGGGRLMPMTAGGGVRTGCFPLCRRLLGSGAGPGAWFLSRWSSGDLGVHGGCTRGGLDRVSRAMGGSRVPCVPARGS